MESQTTLQLLDELIRARSILRHPFYVAWQCGELTREQLAAYGQLYYPHVAAFPAYLQAALEGAGESLVRAGLESNLSDEISNPKAHNELWLDFTESLGLDRKAVANAHLHPAATEIVKTFNRICQEGSPAALAALYAYESQQPEVARQKADGLRQHYGLDNPSALAYFEVHALADVEHREGERSALSFCLENGADPQVVLASASQALDAYWGLLDGICQETGIPLA